MEVKLIDSMANDLSVVKAARVSTEGSKSLDSKESQGLINYLMRFRHSSPFEHSTFTFYVYAPIFVTREIIRHRTAQINEESGRYKVLEGNFYYPEERPLRQVGKTGDYKFEDGNELRDMVLEGFDQAYGNAWIVYEDLLTAGVAKEVARMVLPVGIYSSMYFTVNARGLMNFLSLRTAPNALWEIQYIASQMEHEFSQAMPITFDAWVNNGRKQL